MRKITAEITQSTIDHGRIYLPVHAVAVFPADSFGDRSGGKHVGQMVEFHFGMHVIKTDIRLLSKNRIGPRKSFGLALRDSGAKTGDLLELTQERPTVFTVRVLPSNARSAVA